MKKKIMTIAMSAALSMGTILFIGQAGCTPFLPETVLAEEEYAEALPRVWDEADLLTEEEEAELLEKLDDISEAHSCDVAVVTVESTEGMEMDYFTGEFYLMNGYGMGEDRDGILLMIDMGSRGWYIDTVGYGMTAFTEAGREFIAEQFTPKLSDGNFMEAFTIYGELCDDFLTQAEAGEPYDEDNLPHESLALFWLPVSVLIGLIIAGISTAVMKSSLKSVRSKKQALDYVCEGSMQVHHARDIFLYREVTRRKREDETVKSSTHKDSSGMTHSGTGGSF